MQARRGPNVLGHVPEARRNEYERLSRRVRQSTPGEAAHARNTRALGELLRARCETARALPCTDAWHLLHLELLARHRFPP